MQCINQTLYKKQNKNKNVHLMTDSRWKKMTLKSHQDRHVSKITTRQGNETLSDNLGPKFGDSVRTCVFCRSDVRGPTGGTTGD